MIKHTKEKLESIVKDSLSWADVCRKLNVKPDTGAQYHIRNRALKYGLDIKHFTGQAWRKNKIFGPRRELSEYLKFNGLAINTHSLKLRLIKEKFKEHKCEICNNTSWNNKLLPIELDHINGNNKDNRLENLRILCPNCHAQTNTYCSKNKRVA